MATAEVLRFPEPEIKEFKPSDIDMKLAVKLGLDDLVLLGYNFEGQGIKAGVRALSEFDEDDDRSIIYLALLNERAIGSITTTRWTPEDEFGKKFWGDLKQRNKSLYKRLLKISPLGINIAGITTHPEYRRRGITEKLYEHMVKNENPSFVTGITKTPEAVMARAKHLRKFGFRTFYGNIEVTPDKPSTGPDFYTNVHQDLLDADIKARWEKLEETLDGSDVYLIQGWLNKDEPDTSSFPEYIKRAFEQVLDEQRKANLRPDRKVAIKALISVTGRIKLRPPEVEDESSEAEQSAVEGEQIPLFER